MQMYHDYAHIYDRIGQRQFAESLIDRLLSEMAPPRAALDLACGTGAASIQLAALGSTVVGVDRSPAMLARAAERAGDHGLTLTLIEADLRALPQHPTLKLGEFDLIVCLYDSLNYLLGDDDLAHVFRQIGPLLAIGGRFVFDLNTEAEFQHWNDSYEVVYDGDDLLVFHQLSYDADTARAEGRIVWFERRDERWWRGEERHTERPWALATIEQALEAGGLRLQSSFDSSNQPVSPQSTRVIYLAERA